MEEEIDLRPYIEALIRSWKWILAAGLAAALTAFGVTRLLPPTYEASALVVITENRQLVQFDPRIQSEAEQQPLKAFPELATTDDLLLQVMAQVPPPAGEVMTLQSFRRNITAAAGSDPSLVRLTVTANEADRAAEIANIWAQTFVNWGNDIYRVNNGNQLAFFQAQAAAAESDLAAAEQALVDFQARNRSNIIDNQLSALANTQAGYLAEQAQLNELGQDIASLRAQLSQASGADITLADQLTVLLLQLKTFNAESDHATSLPVQIQFDTAVGLTSTSRSEQSAFLDALLETVNGRQALIDASLASLEPDILALQQERQLLQSEANRLARNLAVAEETYTTLARKVDEERITSEDNANSLRLASESAVPTEPVNSNLVTIILGAIVGMMVATAVSLTTTWWGTTHRLEPAT